jgi:hypothetical protein
VFCYLLSVGFKKFPNIRIIILRLCVMKSEVYGRICFKVWSGYSSNLPVPVMHMFMARPAVVEPVAEAAFMERSSKKFH